MVFAVVAFWIILGLLVVGVAMRGGPAGARQALHGESKVARRVRLAGILLACAFGIGVPIYVLVDNHNHKAQTGPRGVTLTAAQANGRALFGVRCATCHTLAASAAVGRVGPNLDVRMDQVGTSPAAREAVVLAAISSGFARGNNEMPTQLYTGQDASDVASYVAAVGGH